MNESATENGYKKRRSKILLGILIALLALAVLFGVVIFDRNNVEQTVVLEAGESLTPDLFVKSAWANAKILTDLSAIDTSIPSEHTIEVKTRFFTVRSTLIILDTIAPSARPVQVQTIPGNLPNAKECITDIADDCDDASDVHVSYLQAPDVSAPGEQAGIVLLTDSSGNSREIEISVLVVEDDEAPVISGVQDFTVFVGDIPDYASGATVCDDYDEHPSLLIDDSRLDLSTPGVYTIVYIAMDFSGNISTQTANITVIADTQPPVLSGVHDMQIFVGEEINLADGVAVSDDYDEQPTLLIDDGGLDVRIPGEYTITYSATDFSGNTAAETTVVTVIADAQPPVLSGVHDMQIFAGEEINLASGVTVSDDYDEQPTLLIDDDGLDVRIAGEYTITYSATDFSGNTASETAIVSVIADAQPPVLSGVHDMQIFAGEEINLADGVTVSDDYDEQPTLLIDDGGLDVRVPGEYTITYSATDFSGNAAAETAIVTVIADTMAPTISGIHNFTIYAGDSIDYLSGVTVADDYDEHPVLTIDDSSVDADTPGEYTITYSAVDAHGNAVFAKARITVLADTEPPVISGVRNQSIYVDDPLDYISGVTVSDNRDATEDLTLEINASGLDLHTPNTYTITYACADSSGNVATKTSTVLVQEDKTAPVIEGAHNLAVELGQTVSYRQGVSVTDNHDVNPILRIDNSKVNLSKEGVYPVTYTAKDASGNTSSVVVNLYVKQNLLTEEDVDAVYALADPILDEILTDDMTDMEKAFKIYGWTKRHISYRYTSDKINWVMGAYEGFTTRHGDCYIYFSVSKALLTRAGIDNIDVVKSDTSVSEHFWNLINVGTGWYHFDTCPFSNGDDRFFMVTDAELMYWDRTHRPGHTFDGSLYPKRATVSVQSKLNYHTNEVKE